jgi:hypothetical protein
MLATIFDAALTAAMALLPIAGLLLFVSVWGWRE